MKKIKPLDTEISEDLKEMFEFREKLMKEMGDLYGIPKKYLIPKIVVCKKCNSSHAIPEGKDYVICCGEVINHCYGPYD